MSYTGEFLLTDPSAIQQSCLEPNEKLLAQASSPSSRLTTNELPEPPPLSPDLPQRRCRCQLRFSLSLSLSHSLLSFSHLSPTAQLSHLSPSPPTAAARTPFPRFAPASAPTLVLSLPLSFSPPLFLSSLSLVPNGRCLHSLAPSAPVPALSLPLSFSLPPLFFSSLSHCPTLSSLSLCPTLPRLSSLSLAPNGRYLHSLPPSAPAPTLSLPLSFSLPPLFLSSLSHCPTLSSLSLCLSADPLSPSLSLSLPLPLVPLLPPTLPPSHQVSVANKLPLPLFSPLSLATIFSTRSDWRSS